MPSDAAMDDLGRTIDDGLRAVQRAITADAIAGKDAAGGTVESLTEAVMGITAGLTAVAEGLHEIAGAIRRLPGGGE